MNNLLVSYLTLRRSIGIAGLFLPLALLWQAGPQESISAFYFTSARDTFVGTLAVIAAFLAAYKGYDARDTWTARIAACSALVVAFCPATGESVAHTVAAVVLFLCFAVFSGYLFALTHDLRKRRAFRVLGAVILGCIVGALLGGPLFILESLAVVAFALSWLLKSVELRA